MLDLLTAIIICLLANTLILNQMILIAKEDRKLLKKDSRKAFS